MGENNRKSNRGRHSFCGSGGRRRGILYCLSSNIPRVRTLLCIILTAKNTFCGISALGYASYNGYKDITLVGFDALDPDIDSVGNVYEEQVLSH